MLNLAGFVVVGLVTAMSVVDLYLSVKGAEEGILVESNPLFRPLFKAGRWKVVVALKVLATALYAVVVIAAWPSVVAMIAGAVGVVCYAYVMYRQWLVWRLVWNLIIFRKEDMEE